MSFFSSFFDIADGVGEQAVTCPFPHVLNGVTYMEHRPSAHVNLQEKVFHCKSCGTGHSEYSFIQALLNTSPIFARKLASCFESTEDVHMWDAQRTLPFENREMATALGISSEVLEVLKVHAGVPGELCFPVFMYDHLVDIRRYTPNQTPKIKSRQNCPAGTIIPYDIWRQTPKNKVTLLCAGEKDMAVAMTQGFNAITVVGGEMTLPKVLSEFEDRTVVIVYDNDNAGLMGAHRIANLLTPIAKAVKVCTKFHEVCVGQGEDITDFFVKYGKKREDLISMIDATPIYVPVEETSTAPVVDLLTATKAEHAGKILRSNIQVVATDESVFIIPTAITATKTKLIDGTKNYMSLNETRDWELEDNTVKDLLYLADSSLKEDAIKENIQTKLLRISKGEKGVSIKTVGKKEIHKAYVTDLFESSSTSVIPMEFMAYTLGCKLESGKRYLVTYKLVPHPYKGQQLTMIILDAKQANDSVSSFTITPEVQQHLSIFQDLEGTVSERVELLTEKVKGLLGYNGNNTLIQAIDLAYHAVLEFNFGSFKHERGYLDTFIVGESRVGKSSTANALRECYGLGVFTSLAGNAATIPGLVGGSNKVSGSFQTRAGIIPQNHKGLIIFEEFGKSNGNIIKELTDIRSSNEVRIVRVSGTMTMPAKVRMISLTNVKNTGSVIKPISAYPNGISIVTELIGTAEDIARYDMLVVLGDRGQAMIDPFWQPQAALPTEAYRSRIRWIWSRLPEQIIINQEVGRYIIDQANLLNERYDMHIKIFGTEAWKKLSRLSIAVAGYLVSASDDYENIIVTKEHVDFAVQYFIKIYSGVPFKLDEYVEYERQYSRSDPEAVVYLQDLYIKYPAVVLHLEQNAETNKGNLGAVCGVTNDMLNGLMAELIRAKFIRMVGNTILPTERFRLTVEKIEKNTTVTRLGVS